MIKGARPLPVMHLSVRVPWHDAKWAGTVCNNPCANTSCLVLPRISETKDDAFETGIKGEVWDSENGKLPACANERGGFMSPQGYTRRVNHPYSKTEPLYQHFRETRFYHEPYSAGAVPFAWLMKDKDDQIPACAHHYKISYQPNYEPALSFSTLWVQERRNQLMMLDTFFGAIKPEESLVFFYAKRTPLSDDPRRVVVGIGRVLKVGEAVEYQYASEAAKGDMRCVLWERNVHHSIRPGIKDGFLLPYHELLELAASDETLNLEDFVLHAPEDHWEAFSMGSEHVTHDQAITVLLACATLIERFEKRVPGEWQAARAWIDAQLNCLWRLRGAFPGLGSVLTAFGLTHGTLIAHAVGQLLYADGGKDVRDPWPTVDKVLRKPALLPADLAATIGDTALKLWESLKPDRLALLKLLARFELSADQATRWFVPEERKAAGITCSDKEILANPYLIFETDRHRVDSITALVIDRGLFPDPAVTAAVPLPAPSACAEAFDPRRARALMLMVLDRATGEGHTLLPQSWLIQRVRSLEVLPTCDIGGDWIAAYEKTLNERMACVPTAGDEAGWQLHEYVTTQNVISQRVKRRIAGKRHAGDFNWRQLIDAQLPAFKSATDAAVEEAARAEKAKALEELYRSRFSVLIGPAGTGKTSLLAALLSIPPVQESGILLLAPTGKARVQLQKRTANAAAFTLAQFLLGSKRYDPDTGRYLVTDAADRERGYKTVIIDESSMLTEDQLAATFDAIEAQAVERLILVGDHRQLPPIGAGRPFVDIIRFLKGGKDVVANQQLPGYAELRNVRRQAGVASGTDDVQRDDIALSKWFGGGAKEPGADEAWEKLAAGRAVGIRAVRWENDEDLQDKLHAELGKVTTAIAKRHTSEELAGDSAFEVSLGGRPFAKNVYFRLSESEQGADGSETRRGGGADAESWQILAPVRSGESGVDGLNRSLQKQFRKQVLKWAEPEIYYHRKTCKPLGPQRILYGDKVINVANGRRWDVYPKIDSPYLANGEIGLAVGQYKGKNAPYKGLPWQLEVEFSSQLGIKYGFNERDFGMDGDARLELAYALTIHKSQGSEFGTTFVILPNPCFLLSTELLYTALTRQRDEVILFHQGDLRGLLKLASSEHSVTAQRLTNLFEAPHPIEHLGKFLEEKLIHRTKRGEMVRSKSEVIIANMLDSLKLGYAYEQPFTGKDGSIRYPDFTIEDAESGRTVLLEHLGMLLNPAYLKKWKAKLAWYEDNGVIEDSDDDSVTLLTTSEEAGIDSAAIEKKVRAALNM